MRKSHEIRAARNLKIDEQTAIVEGAKNDENRALNEDEKTRFAALQSEIEGMNDELTRAEQHEANVAAAAASRGVVLDDAAPEAEESEKRNIVARASVLKAIRQVNPKSGKGLDGAEKELHEIGVEENRAAGVDPEDAHLCLPFSVLTRADAQTVGEDGGTYGGALVVDQQPRMVEPLRARLPFQELGASFLTGLSGGNIPLVVGADFTMTAMAETAEIPLEKKEFAGPTLDPKRFGGAVDISNKLIMQSSLPVEGQVRNGLSQGWATALHKSSTNGAGGVDILGILNLPGVLASILQTSAGAATYATIVELQSLIEENNATEQSLGYYMHPKIKAALKQISKDAGSGRFLLENDAVDGYKFLSSSLIPTLDAGGTDVFPLIYGDWSQMTIGTWGGINITVDPFTASRKNSVRLVLNAYGDMQIANPKAFAKNAFISA